MAKRILVVLAVIADILSITSFVLQHISKTTNANSDQPFPSVVALGLAILFSWFIFSWALVRRYWRRTLFPESELEMAAQTYNRYFKIGPKKRMRSESDLDGITASTVYPLGIGLGLFLLPFLLWHMSGYHFVQESKARWYIGIVLGAIWCLALIGLLIHKSIVGLMPIIHTDTYEN